MIVDPEPIDDLRSILRHAKPPSSPAARPVPSSSLLKFESPKSFRRKLLPELECMIIEEFASSSLTNHRKVVLLNRTYWQRAKRFKAICASIVYLKLKDERGGQALVFSLYYAGPPASSLLPKLRYLILGDRFISCSSFLRLPSDKKNDCGYKTLWLISNNVNPEHVCMTMKRKWISPTGYRFGLQHLVWLFEHFDQVGSLTQLLDSGKKTRFVTENVILNRFFIPKYPKEQLYCFAGVGDTNSQWSGGLWPEVEVIYGKPRLRDRLQGFPTNVFTPNNARTIAEKEATECVCCGKKQR
ncbi:hypothetical protein L486_01977 [Kwoniella mangroviensis CBS 10435]|uniref:Uncharacterized protein n=1 Tax=Kwoniella mangroviensis CBS 10435 TaxID=1331196 RepID=A0A1B9J3I0_9TREE|nr:hypothetical protein L486_01977 [Kwoniella mangroviensis CBS 10435]